MDAIGSTEDQESIAQQVHHFGHVPNQLFSIPHPSRDSSLQEELPTETSPSLVFNTQLLLHICEDTPGVALWTDHEYVFVLQEDLCLVVYHYQENSLNRVIDVVIQDHVSPFNESIIHSHPGPPPSFHHDICNLSSYLLIQMNMVFYILPVMMFSFTLWYSQFLPFQVIHNWY